GHRMERHRQVLEVGHLQVLGDEAGEPAALVEGGLAPHHVPGGAPPDHVERAAATLVPDLLQALHPFQVRPVGEPGAIPGADRDPHDEIRDDIALDQGTQHPDLSSPPSPTPRNRERRLIAPPAPHDGLSLCKYSIGVHGQFVFADDVHAWLLYFVVTRALANDLTTNEFQ